MGDGQVCAGMKTITLEKVLRTLEEEKPEVEMEKTAAEAARKPLQRMLELS